ncbi:hypothetical protein ABPG75_007997 [Micractinium tetrahymenae]
MQRLSKSMIECLRTAAALRVGTPTSSTGLHELAAAAAGRAQASRCASTAAAGATSSTSSGVAAAAAAQPTPLTLHQFCKRELRPENSGRNAFRRAWAKRLQIKWNAQERKANTAAARQRQHEKRQQQFQQRAQWAAERQQQQAAAP